MKKKLYFGAATLLILQVLPDIMTAQAGIPDFYARFHRMVQLAYADSGEDMKYATSKGAVMTPMADGNGLYLLWKPADSKKALVVLPDRTSDAFREFRFWHPTAEKYRLALIIPQWRSGAADFEADQTTASQIYATTVAPLLISQGFGPDAAVLYGHADSAVFGYGVAAFDRGSSGRRYFGAVVADGGAADFNEPVIRMINGGGLGRHVFEHSRWVLYCSDRCQDMDHTASWLLFHAGQVEVFIQEQDRKGRSLRDDPERLEKTLQPFFK